MIYSPDHKFLLLKNHKVGGTSLEVPVSMIVPENAIVTPKTSTSGVRVQDNWYIQKIFTVNRDGWDIPNKYGN